MTESLGRIIADRLTEFADALESGEPLSAKFTCRKVVLDLCPMAYDPNLVKRTRAILSVSQSIFAHFSGCRWTPSRHGRAESIHPRRWRAALWMRFATTPLIGVVA